MIYLFVLKVPLYTNHPYHQHSDSVARWYVFSSVCLSVCLCVCLFVIVITLELFEMSS